MSFVRGDCGWSTPSFPHLLPRGQSPLHILGQYGRENAAAIFELFLECMPEYPLDKADAEGNTGALACAYVLSHGACFPGGQEPGHTCHSQRALRLAHWGGALGASVASARRDAPRRLIWDTRTSEVSLELPSHIPVHTGLPSSIPSTPAHALGGNGLPC